MAHAGARDAALSLLMASRIVDAREPWEMACDLLDEYPHHLSLLYSVLSECYAQERLLAVEDDARLSQLKIGVQLVGSRVHLERELFRVPFQL